MRIAEPDLPRFRWQPTVRILPFPANRRIGKIRRTAAVLVAKTDLDADRYWKQIAGGMRSQMAAAGLPEDVTVAEIDAFRRAVLANLDHEDRGGRDAP